MDWIIDNHVRESDPQAALQRRRSIEEKIERARHLYINGDLTWQGFTKIKDEAEAALVSLYIPEFDDAVEAGKLLSDFGNVWKSASVGRKNRLLKSMLQAIYVDLDKREVVGLLPKKTFLAPIMAMADRGDVAVVDAKKECFRRNGGDGGGHAPQFPTIPILIEFKDSPSADPATSIWVRDARLSAGISRSELAKSLGVHEKTVQSWEEGKTIPRRANQQKLAYLLDKESVSST